MREKEGVPQGAALFPACGRGCPWLAACQLCLHHWCQWIKSKVSKYAPKKGHKAPAVGVGLHWVSCTVSLHWWPQLCNRTPPAPTAASFPSWKKDLALLNAQAEHFCGCLRAKIHPENFAGGLENQAWYFKIEASFLSLAKIPGNIFLFDSSVAALTSCDITRAATSPAKLFFFQSLQDTNFLLVLRAELNFGLSTFFWLSKTAAMSKCSWLGWDQGALRANGSWIYFFFFFK